MRLNSSKKMKYWWVETLACLVMAFLLLGILIVESGCMTSQKTTSRNKGTGASQAQATMMTMNLQQLLRGADTVRLKTALAGSWQLDRVCQSSFAGLKCDTTLKQDWLLDSLGNVQWNQEGVPAVSDQFHLVKRAGMQAGTSGRDSVWVFYLSRGRRAYLVQRLSQDSLQLAGYPLIMDKTTTYHLHRQTSHR